MSRLRLFSNEKVWYAGNPFTRKYYGVVAGDLPRDLYISGRMTLMANVFSKL